MTTIAHSEREAALIETARRVLVLGNDGAIIGVVDVPAILRRPGPYTGHAGVHLITQRG